MNSGRFFMPTMGIRMTPAMNAYFLPSKSSLGLFGRITSSLRTFNWSNLLNGTNKTLNVVNQTIPLVRQAGPMFNNMKSMLRLAKVFGNETNNHSFTNRSITNNVISNSNISNNINDNNLTQKKEVLNINYPNFFI